MFIPQWALILLALVGVALMFNAAHDEQDADYSGSDGEGESKDSSDEVGDPVGGEYVPDDDS